MRRKGRLNRLPDRVYLSIETFIDDLFIVLEEEVGNRFLLDRSLMTVEREFRFMLRDAIRGEREKTKGKSKDKGK